MVMRWIGPGRQPATKPTTTWAAWRPKFWRVQSTTSGFAIAVRTAGLGHSFDLSDVSETGGVTIDLAGGLIATAFCGRRPWSPSPRCRRA